MRRDVKLSLLREINRREARRDTGDRHAQDDQQRCRAAHQLFDDSLCDHLLPLTRLDIRLLGDKTNENPNTGMDFDAFIK